uniref:CCHC-type domain-containing protein n=1 Tax=Neogobius melanostomus TaxID=47308 RepID=A0A8C6T6L0_9GOBI
MASLQNLTTGMNQLGGRLNDVASQHSSLRPPDPAQSPDPGHASDPALQAPAPTGPQTSQSREPFIPTPSRYSGEIGMCKQFIHQCMLVFDQQPLTYSSDRSKVAFIMSLLSGKASAWAVALSNSGSLVCNTLNSFTSELLRVFDHPLQAKEASSRLLSLRQGSGSVSAFSIDFRILATECGWDDKALQGIYYRGLSEEVKDELAARDETANLEALISLSIRLDNRLRERCMERNFKSRNFVPTFQPRASHLPDLPAPPPQVLSTSEEPMQLGRMTLTQEERQRRFREGLCLYCGQAGHILRSCPKRPKD